MSMVVVNETYAEELYCKIHDRTVLTRFSDGRPDTIGIHLGCTTIHEGQELLKIEFRPVSDNDFKSLFVTEEH